MPYFLHLWVKICSKTDYKLQVRLLKVIVQDLKKEKRKEYMGQVIEKCIIGAGQAKIIKLTITLNNFITLEDQLIPSI